MNILDIAIAKKLAGGGGGSGTDNYNDLSNLPKINDTTLSGNKSSSALGLQSEINSDSKLASDLVDDTNQDNKFVTSTEKNTWNGKQNAIDAGHKINADYVDDSTSTNKFVTSTEKNTWNAKQNAIDSDHKLSSSLVSFTTAEAAALASGIDSSKVGQISTNQTNISYSLQTGVKNLLNFDLDLLKSVNTSGTWSGNVYTLNSVTFTVNDDNTIAVSAGSSHAYTAFVLCSNTADAGNRKRFLDNSPLYLTGGVSGNVNVSVYSPTGTGGSVTSASSDIDTDLSFTNSSGDYNIHIRVAENEAVNATLKPMIRSQMVSDRTYQSFALPNYDLTRLQSEDRAALVECVDNGAKNLFDNANGEGTDYSSSKTTWDPATGTATQVLTDTKSYLALKLQGRSGSSGDWTIIFVNVSVTSNGIVSIPFTAPIDMTELMFGHNGSTADALITMKNCVLKAGGKYYIQCNIINCVQASGAYSWKDIMICDAPLFDISPAYEPHALPNTDLTQLEAEDRAALAEVVDSGAKNIIPFPYAYDNPWTQNGNTYAADANGVIHVTGSNSGANSYFGIIRTTEPKKILKNGAEYVFSIKAVGTGRISNIYMNEIISPNTTNQLLDFSSIVEGEYNQSFVFHDSNDSLGEGIAIKIGSTNTGQIDMYLSIMICTKAEWDISHKYVPYRPSYQELYERIVALEAQI